MDIFNVILFYQPYDEEYLKNHKPPIKHMSFHAFLKKLGGGTDRCVIMLQIRISIIRHFTLSLTNYTAIKKATTMFCILDEAYRV